MKSCSVTSDSSFEMIQPSDEERSIDSHSPFPETQRLMESERKERSVDRDFSTLSPHVSSTTGMNEFIGPSESMIVNAPTNEHIGTDPRRLLPGIYHPPPPDAWDDGASWISTASEMSGTSIDIGLAPTMPDAVHNAHRRFGDCVINMPSGSQAANPFDGLRLVDVPNVVPTRSQKGRMIILGGLEICFWSALLGFFLNSFHRYYTTGESVLSTVLPSALFLHKGITMLSKALLSTFSGRRVLCEFISYSAALSIMWICSTGVKCIYVDDGSIKGWTCHRNQNQFQLGTPS